jgi:hypothetical protein
MEKYKLYNLRFLFFLLLILICSPVVNAQSSVIHYDSALNYMQKNNVDSAKIEIDLHMQNVDVQLDPENWYLEGFIYKELYKKYENENFNSPYRAKSLNSFKKSLKLDTVIARTKTTKELIRYLAGRFYNDAVLTLDSLNYLTSILCYEQYRDAALILDSILDIKKKDIEFNLALGTIYVEIYNSDKIKNLQFFNLTRDTYMKILNWDPNNYTANYDLGLLYWNKGVHLMNNIDYELNLDSVMQVQNYSVGIFKESLPFAQKAYEMEPKREETLIVLSGIFYSLNDFPKSKAFDAILKDLQKEK